MRTFQQFLAERDWRIGQTNTTGRANRNSMFNPEEISIEKGEDYERAWKSAPKQKTLFKTPDGTIVTPAVMTSLQPNMNDLWTANFDEVEWDGVTLNHRRTIRLPIGPVAQNTGVGATPVGNGMFNIPYHEGAWVVAAEPHLEVDAGEWWARFERAGDARRERQNAPLCQFSTKYLNFTSL